MDKINDIDSLDNPESEYNFDLNYKCKHCNQEFWEDNFNIAIFIYGLFLLIGKENEYVGLTCPNCLNTILVKENRELVNYVKQNLSLPVMSFPINFVRDKDVDPDISQGIVTLYFKFKYHSFAKYDWRKNPVIKDFDIKDITNELTENFEDELYHEEEEPPQLEKYLFSYFKEGRELPIGPYVSMLWFREDQIYDLVTIENDEKLRIFPRYIHKIWEIENIEHFCWYYYLPDGQANKDKTSLHSDFVNILTAPPSPFELPITNLSSYVFLWKTPHPFECQSAFKFDPPSASKNDPPEVIFLGQAASF